MQSIFVRRPFLSEPKAAQTNIFASAEEEKDTPVLKKQTLPSIHHFVGPDSLRKQLLSKEMQHSRKSLDQLNNLEERRNLQESPATMGTTIKRSTIFSKMSHSDLRQYTRDARNLDFYKDYEQKWKKQSKLTRRRTDNFLHPTLLDRSKKAVQVMPNPQKEEIVKNYVNTYWEMSLRNNNSILKRHLKGNNRFKEHELGSLLQSEEGIKEVQSSIPRLPIEELNKLSHQQILLSGRNKLASESLSCDPSLVSEYTSRKSRAMTDLPPLKPQVLRSNYDSAHRYLME